jgi:hypothetical protein
MKWIKAWTVEHKLNDEPINESCDYYVDTDMCFFKRVGLTSGKVGYAKFYRSCRGNYWKSTWHDALDNVSKLDFLKMNHEVSKSRAVILENLLIEIPLLYT